MYMLEECSMVSAEESTTLRTILLNVQHGKGLICFPLGIMPYLYHIYVNILHVYYCLNILLSLKLILKATFSVDKLIPKHTQMTTLYTNWSLYITFTMIYYIGHE